MLVAERASYGIYVPFSNLIFSAVLISALFYLAPIGLLKDGVIQDLPVNTLGRNFLCIYYEVFVMPCVIGYGGAAWSTN